MTWGHDHNRKHVFTSFPYKPSCREPSNAFSGPSTHQRRTPSTIFPVNEQPEDPGACAQDEDNRNVSEERAADNTDSRAARGAGNSTDAEEVEGFRLAPDPSGRPARPPFSSLMLPGWDPSRVASAFSGIARTVGFGETIPRLNLQGFIPHVDFSAILPKIEFPWAQRLSELAQRIRERLPPNWPDDIDLDAVQAVIQDDGLPLVWVPRAEIVANLLAAADRTARVELLLAHEQEIIADCRAVLSDVSHDTLTGQLPLAVKALDAFKSGHYEAAQALAVTVTETAVSDALGTYSEARQKAAFDPDRVTLRQLRVQAALAPIGPFYTIWYPRSGKPAPETLSRHVTVHHAEQWHYTRGNSAVAILLLTSVLRALQELAEEPSGEPDT